MRSFFPGGPSLRCPNKLILDPPILPPNSNLSHFLFPSPPWKPLPLPCHHFCQMHSTSVTRYNSSHLHKAAQVWVPSQGVPTPALSPSFFPDCIAASSNLITPFFQFSSHPVHCFILLLLKRSPRNANICMLCIMSCSLGCKFPTCPCVVLLSISFCPPLSDSPTQLYFSHLQIPPPQV